MAVGESKQHDVVPAAATAPAAGVLVLPGARLAYEVTGAGRPWCSFMASGWTCACGTRRWEHLAGRFRVVRYDCRGFGASGPFDPALRLHPCR